MLCGSALEIINMRKSRNAGFCAERFAAGSKKLHNRNLVSLTQSSFRLAFSHDEALLVVGCRGMSKELLLWRTEELFGQDNKFEPIVVKNKHCILSVAISSANNYILAGSFHSMLVYDIQR